MTDINLEHNKDVKKTIYERLLEAQKGFKPAIKDANNPFFRSSYADLSGVWEACREALHANGLFVSQQLGVKALWAETYTNTLITRIYDTTGAHIESEMVIQQKEANNMQSLGSGITYARRYALAAILGIITEDDDGNESVRSTVKKAETKPEPKKETKETYIGKPASDVQRKMYFAVAKNAGYTSEQAEKIAEKMFKLESFKQLTSTQLSKLIAEMSKKADKKLSEQGKTEEEKEIDELLGDQGY